MADSAQGLRGLCSESDRGEGRIKDGRLDQPRKRVEHRYYVNPPGVRVAAQSLQQVQVGGRTYDLTHYRGCSVCNSQYRTEVEKAILQGFSYPAIVRHLTERLENAPTADERLAQQNAEVLALENGDPAPPRGQHHGLTVEKLRRHVLHMPIQQSVQRAVADERVRELGRNMEDFEGSVVDHITFLREGVQRVYARMSDGTIDPDVKDGIAMAKALQQAEVDAEGVDQADLVRAFMAYMNAIRSVLEKYVPEHSRDAMQDLGRQLRNDPVMKELLAQTEG